MPEGATARIRALPALVGRDEELRRLVEAVTSPPGVVVLEGEAGIGKTRLVAEMAGHPALAGRLLLFGGCRRIREPFPLGPLLDALRGVGALLAGRSTSAVTGALRPLLPELVEHLPPAPAPLDDHAAERHRVFRGLAGLLTEVGDAVLVVEDAHWADEQTVDFLGYLLADPPPTLAVVVTYRGEEVGQSLRALTSRLPPAVSRTAVELRPLDVRRTSALAAAILGTDQPVSEEFAAHLWERAAGLPFAIQELLALLNQRGTLVRRAEGWTRRSIDNLQVPVGVRDSVLERVRHLSPGAQAVASAAAVLQEPVPVRVLTAVCLVSRERALDGLAEALRAGLLQEQGALVGFRHMLAVQAVYENVPLPHRQELHGRAATALETLEPVPLGQVAHHLREAQLHDRWVDAAERAADQAAALHDDTEAARLLEDVLRTAPLDPARRGALAVRLGWAAQEACPYPDVVDLLEEALAPGQPQLIRGQLRFLSIVLRLQSVVDLAALRQSASDALEDLDDQPELAGWLMCIFAIPGDANIAGSEHMAWADRALRLVPSVGARAFRVFLLGKVAMLQTLMGDPRWRGLTHQVLELTGGVPAHPKEVNAYVSIADEASFIGAFDVAERLLAAVADAPTGHRLDLVTDNVRLVLDYGRGNWTGLEEQTTVLLEGLRDRPGNWAVTECVSACLGLARGRLDGITSRLLRAIESTVSTFSLDVLLLPTTAFLRVTTGQGDAQEGLARTSGVFRLWETKGMWPLAVRVLPAWVRALTAAGRHAEAAERVAGVDAALRDRDAPCAPAAFAHARGILAAADGDLRSAGELYTEAAGRYAALPCPYEAAQAWEDAAACLPRAQQAAGRGEKTADAALLTALDTYRRLGADWDLDRANRLGRDRGLALPARHRGGSRGYGDSLSPRERQVAALAARGLTNREIGESLFLSARTVEGHLRTVLRKLRLRSRTELSHYLSNAGDENT